MKDMVYGILGMAAFAAFMYGVFAFADWSHKRNGECGGKAGCEWFWCEHYNGN